MIAERSDRQKISPSAPPDPVERSYAIIGNVNFFIVSYYVKETGGQMIIETSRLILREMTTEDLPALRAILQDDEVMYAYGGAFREEEVLAWLKKMQTSYRENGYGLWAVVLKETGRMIGQCGLTNQTPLEETVLEVGYLFAKEFWHRGFAAEAATAVKDYSFSSLHADELFAIIRCTNLASRAVAKRLGMFCTKHFIKHYRGVDMPHFLYRVRRDEPLEISYLADRPEYIGCCASWAYGLWGSQSDGSLDRTLKKFSESVGRDHTPMSLIAIDDSRPAGMISLWNSDHGMTDVGPFIAAFYIHPFHRGRDISMALIDRLIDETIRLGFKELYLATEEAEELYRKFDFRSIRKFQSPYGEAVLMQKSLNQSAM